MREMTTDLRVARESLAQLRRETEIRRKVDTASSVMHLGPAEKDSLEEIVRNHVTRVEELGGRARDLLRESPFGLTPADRSVLDQLQGDRKTLDRDTEQALTNLLGAQRLKTYRKAEKDQGNKERTLRRLGSPW